MMTAPINSPPPDEPESMTITDFKDAWDRRQISIAVQRLNARLSVLEESTRSVKIALNNQISVSTLANRVGSIEFLIEEFAVRLKELEAINSGDVKVER